MEIRFTREQRAAAQHLFDTCTRIGNLAKVHIEGDELVITLG